MKYFSDVRANMLPKSEDQKFLAIQKQDYTNLKMTHKDMSSGDDDPNGENKPKRFEPRPISAYSFYSSYQP